MKRVWMVLLVLMLVAVFAACEAGATQGIFDGIDGKKNTVTEAPANDGALSYDAEVGIREGIESSGLYPGISSVGKSAAVIGKPIEGAPTEGGQTVQAGQLTVCAYDDHEYADYWQGLLVGTQEDKGAFHAYFNSFAFKALWQITVTVEGVPGAKVQLYQGEEVLSRALTDNAGVAYVFGPTRPQADWTIRVTVPRTEGDALVLSKPVEGTAVTFTEDEIAHAVRTKSAHIEVLFVIDTTGSMTDEINYLKAEIANVIGRIEQASGAEVTLGIMVYRDVRDEYVTLVSPFTTDIAAQQEFLAKQSADGGGDTPEAVDRAMTEAVAMQWSARSTKLIVHVADAAAHEEDVPRWHQAVEEAAARGIRIISVASSGIDRQVEYFFRSQSLLTGGVYMYLTNDSGIGGDHLEATVYRRPQVELLNDSLVRVICALHEGSRPITVFPAEEPVQGNSTQGTPEKDAPVE